jgi:hypothetical protein
MFVLAGSLAVAALAVPAAAQTPPIGPTGPSGTQPPGDVTTQRATANRPRARITLHLSQGRDGDVHVGDRVTTRGIVRPFVAGQHVFVQISRDGKTIKHRVLRVHRKRHMNAGGFRLRSDKVVKPGTYRVRAYHNRTARQQHGTKVTKGFHPSYPNLGSGDRGADVTLFQQLLSHEGYYTPHNGAYDSGLQRAVLAFRKVNRMARTYDATPGIFKTLAGGHGGFNLRHPGAGRHVEVDISRQVMALANHRKAQYVFHVSTGAPATPTITGHYHFYSRQPGYNSHGMYYSTYWHGGYAVHGYASVPTYNASHGCVRTPIPNAVFIYNWIQLGESIYTYY